MRSICLMMVIFFVFLISCKHHTKSIEQIKADFGDFQNESITLRPVDYTKTPINKTIQHHPEKYNYLKDVDIYSMAHTSDSLFITGFLVQPKKDGKYPVIIVNRGGNQDLGHLIVATAVNMMAPFAAEGYVVVATNYRGTSRSEGRDQFGGNDVNDVLNLMTSIAELENVDTSRIALLGISRGGMMNYLTLKNANDEHIKAVASIGGISDLSLTMEHHPQIEEVAKELIPDFDSRRDQEIRKRSAVYWANELSPTTPILMLHSMDDKHVYYNQVPVFADSLEHYQIPYQLVSFKNDKHGLLNHEVEVKKMILDWFDRYVKNGETFHLEEKRIVLD